MACTTGSPSPNPPVSRLRYGSARTTQSSEARGTHRSRAHTAGAPIARVQAEVEHARDVEAPSAAEAAPAPDDSPAAAAEETSTAEETPAAEETAS